jgi:hypothetical protein
MKLISQLLSVLFMPVLTPFYCALLLINTMPYAVIYTQMQKLFFTIGVLLLTGIIPLVGVALQRRNGLISDMFISRREERLLSYLITLLTYVACLYFLWYIGMERWVILLMGGAFISVILIALINCWWKVSAHGAGMGGLCGAVFGGAFVLGVNPVGLFCLTVLVTGAVLAARVYLGAHTVAQTLVGCLIGCGCAFSATLCSIL